MKSTMRVPALLALLLPCLCTMLAAGPAVAGEPDNLKELSALGAVIMDYVSTPLLHHVATGTPYDISVLAGRSQDDHANVDRPQPELRSKVLNRNEFIREEAVPQWTRYVQGRIAEIGAARSYVIPLQVSWQEYDFSRKRYNIAWHMNRLSSLNGGPSYHCAGAFAVTPKRELRTACLHAVNEDEHDPFLQSFPIDNMVLARDVREKTFLFRVYAVAEPAGPYKVLKGTEIRYMPLQIYAAAGFQPVRITRLLLTNSNNGDIYEISTRPGAAPWGTQATAGTGTGSLAIRSDAAPTGQPGTGPAAPAGWQFLLHDQADDVYVDAGSIKRNGAIVIMRVLLNYGASASQAAHSRIVLYENDCAHRTSRELLTKRFAEADGKGIVVAERAAGQSSQPALPVLAETIGETLYNFSCNAAVPRS